MKKISILEAVLKGEVKCKDAGIPYVIATAYDCAKQNGNKMLCLQDTIWDQDVPAIVEFMRNNGIKKFAIASAQSSMIETLGIFQENGVKIKGVETMKSRHKKFWSDEFEDIPAMVMEVK
jgi:hypothetical protein